MKKYTPFIFLMIFIAGIVACNKYEYGPSVSLRTKKGRLTNDWILENVILNRTDTLMDINPTEVSFTKDDEVFYNTTYTSSGNTDSTVERTGEWTLDNDGLSVVVIFEDSLGQKDAELFEILKLTNSELWLSQMQVNDEYILQFIEKP